ncbi:hypothetical protein BGW38_007488 [Lunasporangiospora selenospora]|uniref:Uncharacterized protein n=1 Tax=Lunasporangiospora selenospora TaxID=979761 RepID=A0A9P6FYV6_9FUNG|nr:hypothetical protein BGW38_007488 [Lunasporangiospora selenospora]
MTPSHSSVDRRSLRPSFFLALFLGLALTVLGFLPSTALAQTQGCLKCIQTTIPKVKGCTQLSQTQLTELDTIIHGIKAKNYQSDYSTYSTKEPVGFKCLSELVYDSVHYKATLWSTCLDPRDRCSWTEMMQYMQIITRMGPVYGLKEPPAQILVDSPV